MSSSDKNRTKTVSKAMSYLLRHHAPAAGISIRPDGFVKVSDLLGWKRMKQLKVTLPDLHRVVEENDKKRFHMTKIGEDEFIRAAQGHSIDVCSTLE